MSGSRGRARDTVRARSRALPLVSSVLDDARVVEMLHRRVEGKTLFCVAQGEDIRYAQSLEIRGTRYVPYAPTNNLLASRAALFPSEPSEYGTEEKLVEAVRAFVHRYVQLSPLFERVAAYYVLLTWLYDAFNELPYLRVRGDYGSGKTRFLLVVGSICYKPLFASGASTVSPIFRMLDAIKGTLIVDEADFRFSDEKAEIVKILNNGNARGFPVLRSESKGKEFNPRAYSVFGPKLVATRGHFRDQALESRCLTEEMGTEPLRGDVPINLPKDWEEEALGLRNQLLLFRIRRRAESVADASLVDRTIEPRLAQIFVPLLSVIADPRAREELRGLARRYQAELVSERGTETEAQVLEVIRDMVAAGHRRGVKDVTAWFADRHADDYERKVTARWIGGVIRRKLRLTTHKTGGVYVIPDSDATRAKLERLYGRYGVAPAPDAAPPAPPVDVGT